jgi:Zn finger protein HypA/HybF involved in hydrogenase expression
MIVRCGRCQSGFDVPGPGRHTCPTCGTLNEVRAGDATVAPSPSPPVPPEPEVPSRRVSCESCGFGFIVGAVDEAPCPNCGTPVVVGSGEGGEA